jgi:hypothetical protein
MTRLIMSYECAVPDDCASLLAIGPRICGSRPLSTFNTTFNARSLHFAHFGSGHTFTHFLSLRHTTFFRGRRPFVAVM